MFYCGMHARGCSSGVDQTSRGAYMCLGTFVAWLAHQARPRVCVCVRESGWGVMLLVSVGCKLYTHTDAHTHIQPRLCLDVSVSELVGLHASVA